PTIASAREFMAVEEQVRNENREAVERGQRPPHNLEDDSNPVEARMRAQRDGMAKELGQAGEERRKRLASGQVRMHEDDGEGGVGGRMGRQEEEGRVGMAPAPSDAVRSGASVRDGKVAPTNAGADGKLEPPGEGWDMSKQGPLPPEPGTVPVVVAAPTAAATD